MLKGTPDAGEFLIEEGVFKGKKKVHGLVLLQCKGFKLQVNNTLLNTDPRSAWSSGVSKMGKHG